MAFVSLGMKFSEATALPAPPVTEPRPPVVFPPLLVVPDRIHVLAQRMIRMIGEEQHLCGFTDEELEAVLLKAREVLSLEPALVSLTAPLVVFGDVNGQLGDLLRFLAVVDSPPDTRMLFLGNYCSRWKKSLEVLMLLLCYKILHPEGVFLLRGSRECAKLSRIYGLYKELKQKRSEAFFERFNQIFNELPLCAIVSGSILCVHSGISHEAMSWDVLKTLKKPRTQEECERGVALDLLWAEPTMEPCGDGGFRPNQKKPWSVQFDKTTVKRVCDALGVDFICRGGQEMAGHQWHFGHQLVSLFSAPNHTGLEGNAASVMLISRQLAVSFITLKPRTEKKTGVNEQSLRRLKARGESLQKTEEMAAAAMTSNTKK